MPDENQYLDVARSLVDRLRSDTSASHPFLTKEERSRLDGYHDALKHDDIDHAMIDTIAFDILPMAAKGLPTDKGENV